MDRALLVIDMQQGAFDPAWPGHDVPGLVARLNILIAEMRAAGAPVVFIQHDGPPGEPLHPSAPGWRFIPELDVRDTDKVIRKTSCDSFLGTGLAALLEEKGIHALVVTGGATEFCVDTTVRSALGRGYRTLVPRDGHTTFDRPSLTALQVIAHHNAIWADFAAPNGPAKLCTCADALRA